jgi:hypothetical protein
MKPTTQVESSHTKEKVSCGSKPQAMEKTRKNIEKHLFIWNSVEKNLFGSLEQPKQSQTNSHRKIPSWGLSLVSQEPRRE